MIPSTGPSSLPIPYTQSDIVALAQAQAADLGDPNPTLIQTSAVVPRSQATTIATAGDTVKSSDPSLVIAIQGNFTSTAAGPPGPTVAPLAPMVATTSASPPQTLNYSVITLVVNTTTGEVTDYGLTNDYPGLSSLGPVTTASANG